MLRETAASPEPHDGLSPKEKYEYLTQYGTQILCLFNAKTGCGYLSQNFETITGNKVESAYGDAFHDMVQSDFQPRLRELLEMPAAQSKPHVLRCKLRHGDDKYYWYVLMIHSKQNGGERLYYGKRT